MTALRLVVAVAIAVLGSGALFAQDMPDPALMHGRSVPAPEYADGLVTVRVVREALGNNLPGQEVHVTADGKQFRAVTNELGRAEFRDLPRGASAVAEATIDGEALRSQPFQVPVRAGLQVILVAGLETAAARRQQEQEEALTAPPVRGAVVLGGETHVITEFQSDNLRVFYRLDILNSARTRVDTGGPLILELPREAAGAAALGTAPPGVTISGTRVAIAGPFEPGVTRVDFAYTLQYSGSSYTLEQTWPVAVQQWMIGVERLDGLVVTSPQVQDTEERRGQDGARYLVGTGPALPAGSTLRLELSNLPAHSQVAARVTILLALGIIGVGAWLSRAGSRSSDAAATLRARRDTLMGELEALEKRARAGRIEQDRYTSRRERLMRELEQVYAELDTAWLPASGDSAGAPSR
jgi:hypothetical protein